jgi:hypothetical protein
MKMLFVIKLNFRHGLRGGGSWLLPDPFFKNSKIKILPFEKKHFTNNEIKRQIKQLQTKIY